MRRYYGLEKISARQQLTACGRPFEIDVILAASADDRLARFPLSGLERHGFKTEERGTKRNGKLVLYWLNTLNVLSRQFRSCSWKERHSAVKLFNGGIISTTPAVNNSSQRCSVHKSFISALWRIDNGRVEHIHPQFSAGCKQQTWGETLRFVV